MQREWEIFIPSNVYRYSEKTLSPYDERIDSAADNFFR
jgi:hypothetical protein